VSNRAPNKWRAAAAEREPPSAMRRSEERRDRWVYSLLCGNKANRRRACLSEDRQARPRGLSLAAISALNSRDGPRNRSAPPASQVPRRCFASNAPHRSHGRNCVGRASNRGRQARNASPRPSRGVGYTAGRAAPSFPTKGRRRRRAARQSGPT